MQIWRMKADGSQQEQLTDDEAENWFPHVAPNSQTLVFLTYAKGVGRSPGEQGRDAASDGSQEPKVDVLAKLFGGQGTINVSSWSPDSQYLAFVSYQVVPQ